MKHAGTSNTTLCLSVQDQNLPAHVGGVVRCVVLLVHKCEVCVGADDTLMDIAKEYRTSWYKTSRTMRFLVIGTFMQTRRSTCLLVQEARSAVLESLGTTRICYEKPQY
eukprot:246213-Rhodomonas_salina.1